MKESVKKVATREEITNVCDEFHEKLRTLGYASAFILGELEETNKEEGNQIYTSIDLKDVPEGAGMAVLKGAVDTLESIVEMGDRTKFAYNMFKESLFAGI